ncbi:hypothetical protein ACHAWF_011794, partial [Thalassiosira exigua]
SIFSALKPQPSSLLSPPCLEAPPPSVLPSHLVRRSPHPSATMMMERAKTAPAPEPAVEKPAAPPSTVPPLGASAAERVEDLERRLNDLGGGDATPVPAAPAPAAASQPRAQTGQNNPLLKRIQAAQERARAAEEKEREEKALAAAEAERRKRQEEEAIAREAEEARIAQAQSALRAVAGRALEEKQNEILAQLEGKEPIVAPSQGAADADAATPAVPIMKSLDPPPPSFDSMKFPPPRGPAVAEEMVGHGMNSRALTRPEPPLPPPPTQQQQAPPSFDFVEQQLKVDAPPPPPPAPTAPNLTPVEDHLEGVMPMAPPAQMAAVPPPPSFAEFEQSQTQPAALADDEGLFEYDLDGNPLSDAERQRLLDEQRTLYESIMKEKAANEAAIARASADAFDARSSNAAARAMSGSGPAGTEQLAASNATMDAAGRDLGYVAPPAAAGAGQVEGAATEQDEEAAHRESRRMVKIGNNQMVALHGQDRTKRAIKDGTAVLVQCINCQNWMQVTETATLMFCPVCQVVSPVVRQNEVLTKEEAIQLTMDRKLAEKLQQEAYAEGETQGTGAGTTEDQPPEGFVARMLWNVGDGVERAVDSVFGEGEHEAKPSASATAASAGKQPRSDSWWNKITSVVSYGVAQEPKERGDVGVTRPPGAPPSSEYPAQRQAPVVHEAPSRSPTHQEETRGLLSPVIVDGDEERLPAGRVAEQRPLFSCLADTASAMFSAGEGARDAEGNVNGVDASSLLVTGAGRGVGDGAGDYSRVPENE